MMMIDVLMLIGVFDGVIIGCLALIYIFKSLSGLRRQPLTPVVAPVVIADVKKKMTKKVDTAAATVVEVPKSPKTDRADGLSLLITETRKNSKACSVCGAYTTFYDNGKFIQEGMTSTGVINHLDIVHRGKVATSEQT